MNDTADENGSLRDSDDERNASTPELEEGFRKVVDRIRKDLVDEPAPAGEGKDRFPELGDYTILRQIGSGGMARVYEAEQKSLKRKVALKILPSHLRFSDDAIKKFKREAEAGGRQNHPGIVSIHAVGEHEGVHYIAQELVPDGRTLTDRLDELRSAGDASPGSFRDAAVLIADVADALQDAHAGGVIHRDVKPSNILLTMDGCPKVTDFGLAKVVDALALSRTGDFTGTPYYMSPEQAMSRRIRITHSTDIFSLGVTFYEYLTLERPFQGKTSHDVLKKIVFHEPRDPRKVNPRVPRDLAVICLKAMEKKPEDRYPDMAALAADLRRFLSGDVIMARPTSPVVKLWKRMRRNPVVSAAVATAVLAVIVLLTVVPWVIVQKEREIARQEKETRIAVEKKEREIARKEREKRIAVEKEVELSKALLAFMKSMLTSPKPWEGGGNVRVVEVLERASDQLDTAFPGRPEIEMHMRNIIGSTLDSLCLFDEAVRHYRRGVELCHLIHGKESKDTIYFTAQLAAAMAGQGNLDEAEELAVLAMETGLRHHGEMCEETAMAIMMLARIRSAQSRFVESAELYRRSIGIMHDTVGEGYLQRLTAMGELATVLMLQYKLSESERLYREALEISTRLYGADRVNAVSLKEGLAKVLVDMGQLPEAEKLMRETLEFYRRVCGEEHLTTLDNRTNLAKVASLKGNMPEAERICRDVLETMHRVYGEESQHAFGATNILGTALLDQGKFEEVESMMRPVVEMRRRVVGEDNPQTADSMNTLACALKNLGKLEEAEPFFRKALEVNKRHLGPGHSQTLLCMGNLANTVAGLGRLDEAETLLRNAFETAKRELPPSHWTIIVYKANLGRCLYKLERYDEAEPLLVESCSKMIATLGPFHIRSRACAKYMIELYEKLGRPEKVKEYQELLKVPVPSDP